MQRETLVARAIVAYEVQQLREQLRPVGRSSTPPVVAQMRERRASTPLPRVTTDRIVEKYGLHWGMYVVEPHWYRKPWGGYGRTREGQSRAHHNVRKELNAAFRRGELVKLRDLDSGKKLREARCVVFTTSGVGALRLRGENLRAIWHDE